MRKYFLEHNPFWPVLSFPHGPLMACNNGWIKRWSLESRNNYLNECFSQFEGHQRRSKKRTRHKTSQIEAASSVLSHKKKRQIIKACTSVCNGSFQILSQCFISERSLSIRRRLLNPEKAIYFF